jgi:hypothetical protein
VIELTQKKLREVRFFLIALDEARQKVVRNEPEETDFSLSAFLSAARAVTWALAWEEPEKYQNWKDGWFARQSEDDGRLLKFFVEQRNYTQKRGGAEVTEAWEYIPITKVMSQDRSHPAYGFHW